MYRLILLLALVAAPALAGTRAIYTGADGKRIVIEVADNGDARIGADEPDDYGLLVGGRFHIVGRKEGRLTVARAEDVATAMDRALPIFGKMLRSAPAPDVVTKPKPDGTAEVAGRKGRAYRVPREDGGTGRLVVSDDPALKPVGAALEGFSTAAILPMAVLLGPAAVGLEREVRAMFALGTPIETPDGLRLTEVTTVDVAPERVRLPAEPLSVEALVAEMRQGMKPKPVPVPAQ